MKERSLAKHIAGFGKCYDVFSLFNFKRIGLESRQFLPERPLDAMFLFSAYAHERQGRNPRFALIHRRAILEALGADIYTTELNSKFAERLLKTDFPKEVWKNFQRIARKANWRQTRGPLRDVLERLQKARQPNIFAHVTNMQVPEARSWLAKIRGIGPKISSFIVRDWFSFAGKRVADQELWLAQPVDLWVRFWSKRCWQDIPSKGQHDKCSIAIAVRCRDEGIDAIAFNKGAWFVGANFSYLCALHELNEMSQLLLPLPSAMPSEVWELDPQKVTSALQAYDGKAILIL